MAGPPRGGVHVAFEVAARLKAPLDAFLRKHGVAGRSELAMEAITEGAMNILNRDLIRDLGSPHG